MNGDAYRCGLDGCEYPKHSTGNHVWKKQVSVTGCLPTSADATAHYFGVWVDINDAHRRVDEIMVGVFKDVNGEDGIEVWLTASEAEEIHNLLGSAIRRHTGYRGGAR